MTSPAEPALGASIRDARKRAGLSQEDLAAAIGVDRTAINKIEGGTRRVTALELSDISNALGVRMTSFFLEPTPSIVSHRSSEGLDTAESQIDALLASLAADVEFLRSLGANRLVDQGPTRSAYATPPPETQAEAESLAQQARHLMDLTETEPITHLSNSVSSVGLLAFARDIGPDTADAGTLLLREGGIALINSHMKVGRRRLALAHELGHYLIADEYTIDWRIDDHPDGSVQLESRLDRFARALLLPASTIPSLWTAYCEGADPRSAGVRLASQFRVDMATLARRLRELGAVDHDTAARIRAIRTTRADIVEFDLHVPLEELRGTSIPRAFALAVISLVRDEKISRERALDLLQGTFTESDLPAARTRRPDEIWHYVS